MNEDPKTFLSILFLLLTVPAWCVAADKPPQVIADGWIMIPKAGHEAKLEEAIKAHMAHRHEKGDPRHWDTYVPVTGDKLNRYIVRSCCRPWAEQDTYRKWSYEHASKHFNETVHPHVEKYIHNYAIVDTENSNWGDDVEANYVGVRYWTVKPGKNAQANKAIKKMSTLAKENNWPRNWSWSYPVGGANRVMLAVPFKNFADMAPMDESFSDFAKKHMKEKKVKEMFKKFDSSFSNSDYTIYRHDKNLSMPHDEKE